MTPDTNDDDDDDASDREALTAALSEAYAYMRMTNNIFKTCAVLSFIDLALFYMDFVVSGIVVAVIILSCLNAWVEARDWARDVHERLVSISTRIERRRNV